MSVDSIPNPPAAISSGQVALCFDQVWPRDVIEPDLMVECIEGGLGGHVHLAHAFPLYVLSGYFHKAILFENRRSTGLYAKRLKLPFRCLVVKELINFAYDGQMSEPVNIENNFTELLAAAEYTISLRMKRYLLNVKESIEAAAKQEQQKQ